MPVYYNNNQAMPTQYWSNQQQPQQQAAAPAQAPVAPASPSGGQSMTAQAQAPAGGSLGGFATPQTGYTIGGNVALPQTPAAPNVNLNQQGVNAPSTQWNAYQNLLANPGSITSNPEYQFQVQQGQQALDRTLGANQQRFSGNAMTAAQQFGQGLASQNFNNLANTLGNASQLELSRFLQPAQAQAGLNVNQGQLANQNWANLSQTLLGNYQANTQNATMQNQANQQQYLNQQSQQGFQNLLPQVQNIASALTGNAPMGGEPAPQPFMTSGGMVQPQSAYNMAPSDASAFSNSPIYGYSGQNAMNFINQGY